MPCFHPLKAFRMPPGFVGFRGKGFSEITFDSRYEHFPGVECLSLPCGQCLGCRLEKSRQWAMRIMCEQRLFQKSCFITLTYDEEHLPDNFSLKPDDVTLFLKRLRFNLDKLNGSKIRYFYCGEYGAKTHRPHYHMCLFGEDFEFDREVYKYSLSGTLYKSQFLENTWQNGFCPFGELTWDSAAYTARYILKKVTGDPAAEHYGDRKPEFIQMSRRPGIGGEFVKKFSSDIYPKDFIVLPSGIRARPPKYFDRVFANMHEFKGKRLSKQERIERLKQRKREDFVLDYNPLSIEAQNFINMKKRRVDHVKRNLISDSELKQREEYAKILTKQINERRVSKNVV